jgi:nucleoside 2-deoxyribosyltransferase
MKVYITCPCSHSQKRLDLLPTIKTVAKKCEVDYFVFRIGGTSEEIFKRDYSQIKNSDVLIAEVSERSHGVGIEIGMSYCLGLKRILLISKGEYVTKLAQGMPDTVIISYKNKDDLKKKLKTVLLREACSCGRDK